MICCALKTVHQCIHVGGRFVKKIEIRGYVRLSYFSANSEKRRCGLEMVLCRLGEVVCGYKYFVDLECSSFNTYDLLLFFIKNESRGLPWNVPLVPLSNPNEHQSCPRTIENHHQKRRICLTSKSLRSQQSRRHEREVMVRSACATLLEKKWTSNFHVRHSRLSSPHKITYF
jgi:hypothetical protein